MQIPPERIRGALDRVMKRKSDLKRQTELFYTFLFAVTFGVVTALVSEVVDNLVRHDAAYPAWYMWTVFILWFLSIVGLIVMFVRLHEEEKDVMIMEENLDEMLSGK